MYRVRVRGQINFAKNDLKLRVSSNLTMEETDGSASTWNKCCFTADTNNDVKAGALYYHRHNTAANKTSRASIVCMCVGDA